MIMRTFAVMNRKGGTGKTATCLAMLDALTIKGFRAVAVDTDPQRSVTMLTGASDGPGLAEALTGQAETLSVVHHTTFGDVISAGTGLDALEDQLKGDALLVLRETLQELAKDYDFCILDCQPGLGGLSLAALVAADEVIVPTPADSVSLFSLSMLVDAINMAKKFNPGVSISGVLITMWDARPLVARKMLEVAEGVAENLGTIVFQTKIRRGKDVPESVLMGTGLITYAPKSNPATDYVAFVDELLQKSTVADK